MALSNSRNFETVRNDIIEGALRKVGAIAQSQAPSSYQYTNCAKALNSIVKALQAEHVFLWESSTGSQVITAGTASYTLSTDILFIDNVYVRRNNSDLSLSVISEENYNMLSDKSTTYGQPRYYTQKLTLSGLIVTVYPFGESSSTDTLYYTQFKKLQDYDTASDTTPFMSYWTQALIYLLSFDIAPEYGLPVERMTKLESTAGYWKEKAKGFSNEKGGIRIRPHKRRK